MTDKVVTFVGAGPGNPKLITLLGKEKLEEADLVVYAGSLVNPVVVDYCKGERVDSYGLTLEDISKRIADALEEGKKVVRLHSGDPSLYGNVVEQMEELKKYGVTVERVPGVSSVFATRGSTQGTFKAQRNNGGLPWHPEDRGDHGKGRVFR
jgi:precorrin-4/cobalt-precorrin-4 C11-methyltransferase